MGYREGAIMVGFCGRNSSLEFHIFGCIVFTERFDKTGHFRIAHRYVVDKQIYLRKVTSVLCMCLDYIQIFKNNNNMIVTWALAFKTVEELGPKSAATMSKLYVPSLMTPIISKSPSIFTLNFGQRWSEILFQHI